MKKKKKIASKDMLEARIQANQAAKVDFDEWCKDLFPPQAPGSLMIDLGCGTGKQLSLFHPFLEQNSRMIGIDISSDNIDKAGERKLERTTLLAGDFKDGLDQVDEKADLIYVMYALYYTEDLPGLMKKISEKLNPGGTFWMVGPNKGNNAEFLSILNQFYPTDPFLSYCTDEFPGLVWENAIANGLRPVRRTVLKNEIPFATANAFMTYLKNSLFYKAGFDEEIEQAVSAACEADGRFMNRKSIISLQFIKG